MAEIVALNQEKNISEYEAILKYNVMEFDSMRKYKATIESFEYKLNSNRKSIAIFSEYILYKKGILTLVMKAEERRGINLRNLKRSILKRIINLYEEGTRAFPSQFCFWDSYIKFCKTDIPEKTAETYRNFLLHHGDRPLLWCAALCWEYEFGRNINKCKHIFYESSLRHPKSQNIYTIFFGIVLAETKSMITKNPLALELKSENMARLNSVYRFAKKNVNDCKFLLSLLRQCEDKRYCGFTIPLQKLIVDDLIASYPLNERLWDTLAQRELSGFCMSDLQQFPDRKFKADCGEVGGTVAEENTNKSSSNVVSEDERANDLNQEEFWKKRSLKRRIELCCKTYRVAVRTVKSLEMMNLYLNTILKLNLDMNTLAPFKRNILAVAFKEGHELRLLSSAHYVTLVKMLLKNNSLDLALDVLATATKYHNTTELYQLWLSIYILENTQSKVYEIFRLATKTLTALEAAPLWALVLKYYITVAKNCTETLQTLFQEACRHSCSKYEIFRTMYLDWSFANLCIEKTRIQYDEMIKFPPATLDLHKKMAQIESTVLIPNIIRWRLCHENAVNSFGEESVDVWMEYINFEKYHGDPKRIPFLCQRARIILRAELMDRFNMYNFSIAETKKSYIFTHTNSSLVS